MYIMMFIKLLLSLMVGLTALTGSTSDVDADIEVSQSKLDGIRETVIRETEARYLDGYCHMQRDQSDPLLIRIYMTEPNVERAIQMYMDRPLPSKRAKLLPVRCNYGLNDLLAWEEMITRALEPIRRSSLYVSRYDNHIGVSVPGEDMADDVWMVVDGLGIPRGAISYRASRRVSDSDYSRHINVLGFSLMIGLVLAFGVVIPSRLGTQSNSEALPSGYYYY